MSCSYYAYITREFSPIAAHNHPIRHDIISVRQAGTEDKMNDDKKYNLDKSTAAKLFLL
jgi:hypothetical protein